MKKKIKDVKKIKKSKKATAPICLEAYVSYEEFKEMMSGLTDEELSLVSAWLLDHQHKP